MKRLLYIFIFGIGWCGEHSEYILIDEGHGAPNVEAITEPYISPGLQIGFNSNKEFFYGFQLSAGILHYPTSHIYYSPSICFGLKKYSKSKLTEKYIDLQMMSLPDARYDGGIPIGFGIGMNHSNGQSNMRIKGYTWFMSCITLDYDIKRKLYNTSLIPVLPISLYQLQQDNSALISY